MRRADQMYLSSAAAVQSNAADLSDRSSYVRFRVRKPIVLWCGHILSQNRRCVSLRYCVVHRLARGLCHRTDDVLRLWERFSQRMRYCVVGVEQGTFQKWGYLPYLMLEWLWLQRQWRSRRDNHILASHGSTSDIFHSKNTITNIISDPWHCMDHGEVPQLIGNEPDWLHLPCFFHILFSFLCKGYVIM